MTSHSSFQREFPHVQERESNVGQYGEVYGGLLNAMLGILELMDRRTLIAQESKALATAGFRSFVAVSAPKIDDQAIRWRAKAAAEAAELSRLDGERRQQQMERKAAEEKAEVQRQKAESEKRFRDFLTEQEKAAKELAEARAREKICQ
jgi:hypothetical protein